MLKMKNDTGWLHADEGDIDRFTCRCDICGSEDVEIRNSLSMGSSWTGMYGSIDICCNSCKNTVELYS
jgi:hypothetical protein